MNWGRRSVDAMPGSWASWVNVVAGVWLLISLFLTESLVVPAALWNNLLVGLLLVGFSWAATRTLSPIPSWVNVALGVWLIVSPMILPYQGFSQAIANDLIIGTGVTLLSLIPAISKMTFPHGRVRGV